MRAETAGQDVDYVDSMGQGDDVAGSGWQPSASSTQGRVITSGGQSIGAEPSDDEDDGALKPLP